MKKTKIIINTPRENAIRKDTIRLGQATYAEKTAADMELKQSREQFQKIMDQSLDVICTINEQGRFVKLGAASFTTWGYLPEELVGKECMTLVREEDIEKTRLAFLSIMKGSETNHFENRCRRKSGELVFITWSARWDSDDKMMYCVARDTTALKKTEKKIREERMLLRSLIDILPIHVYTKDLQTRKTLANRTDYEYAGFSSEAEVLGKTDFELYSDESAQRTFIQDQQVLITGEPIVAKEEEHIKKDGTKTCFLISKIPLRNEEKEITGLMGISYDITERKEAEEKIRVAKERYDIVVKATNEAVWDWDILTSRLYWGENYRALFGYDPEEVHTLDTWSSHVHPDDVEKVVKSVINIVRDPVAEKWEQEYRFIKADGSFAHVMDRGYVIRDTDGVPIRMIGALQDVTEHKKRERDLAISELSLRRAQEISHIGSWDADFASKKSTWSDETYRVLGYEKGEIESSVENYLARVHPEDLEFVTEIIEKAKTVHDIFSFTHRILKKGGEVAIIYTEGRFVFDEYQVPVSVYGVHQDITRQKTAEDALQKRKMQLTVAADIAKLGYWELDLDTRIFTFNDEFYALLKTTVEKMGGYQMTEEWYAAIFLAQEDRDVVTKEINKAIENSDPKDSYHIEHRITYATGDNGFFAVRFVVVRDENGQPLKVMGAMQDITERKRNETSIRELNAKLNRRAEELTASNAELEQFAYVASHDLQEPLRMISSFLQLLQKKYAGQLDETAAQYIGQAVSGSERMKRLIMDLLEYSRVGTNQDKLKPVDMSEVMRQVLQIFSNKTQETNAIIKVSLMPVIHANRMQVTQLFQNLLGNAFKYNDSAVPEIEIGCEEKEDAWQFFVKDNGIGIDPKFFDKVFIIFQRLHTRTQFSGTGIGLAICKKVVERHGGQIWVASKVGHGSTFFFTIKK